MQCFSAAKYIVQNADLKLAKGHTSPDNEQSNVSIGLLIGTPFEILQYIEEGSVVPAEIRYLVSTTLNFSVRICVNALTLDYHSLGAPGIDHTCICHVS